MRSLVAILGLLLAVQLPSSHALLGRSNGLQDVVTYDSHSVFIRGQRTMIWSGEYHPFRLPSPGLWLDVFQKIKATGYSAVSFYLDWALLEGKQGSFRSEGVLAIEPFVQAASQAGIYLIARTGPYINSESSGGGLPGWLQRCPDALRSDGQTYMSAALNYTARVADILAPYQITRGGPIILWQVENEYTNGRLYPGYMQALEQTAIAHGIVVPTTHNDAYAKGDWISGQGAVNIYGSDGYPFGYGSSCANPYNWPSGALPDGTVNYATHKQQNPQGPFGIMEYQGGNPVGWGGSNPAFCGDRFGAEWERLFYKNIMANGVTIFNVYMTYGGTNWGGISFPGGVTTYDQYSILSEDRQVTREKYSEVKLQATFLQSSPAYLTSTPNFAPTNASVSANTLSISTLEDSQSPTRFLVVRHNDYTSTATTPYTLTFNSSQGQLTVPQLSKATLTLFGRDSKVHLVDYAFGRFSFIYSSAELFTWTNSSAGTTAVLYGGPGETHEFALPSSIGTGTFSQDSGLKSQVVGRMTVVQWTVGTAPVSIHFNAGLVVHLYPRQQAYNLWAVSAGSGAKAIVDGGYLIRNATIVGSSINLLGDVNTTTTVKVIAAPAGITSATFNGRSLNGLSGEITYTKPSINLPDLQTLSWKYHDSLPEIGATYDDSAWTQCNKTSTNLNTPLRQPTSQYSGDYGYHVGTLVYRGHFTSTGNETGFRLISQGGLGFAHAAWLDDKYLGSFSGSSSQDYYDQTWNFPGLAPGSKHVITTVIDNMGYEMDFVADSDQMKTPRGIVQYSLNGRSLTDITWRMTGNLGGEEFQDPIRGPLNEGGLYAERQGWHLPGAPTQQWETRSPLKGISAAGVGFFSTTFSLNLPRGYDIPLSFVFPPAVNQQGGNYRFSLFVNGYWMGRYVHNLGPQSSYPVPEGVLNCQGQNYVAILLWAQDQNGAALQSMKLQATAVVQSSYGTVSGAPQPRWTRREGAY